MIPGSLGARAVGSLYHLNVSFPKASAKPSWIHVKKLLLHMGAACG